MSNVHIPKLWQDFWEKGESEATGKIRINPEIRIRWRQADEEVKKFLEKNKFDLAKTKHRRLKGQYTVHLTFALNAGKKHPDLAFMKPEELRKKINNFNKNFNEKQDFEKLWKIWH